MAYSFRIFYSLIKISGASKHQSNNDNGYEILSLKCWQTDKLSALILHPVIHLFSRFSEIGCMVILLLKS